MRNVSRLTTGRIPGRDALKLTNRIKDMPFCVNDLTAAGIPRDVTIETLYQIISPKALLSPFAGNTKYADLSRYLSLRYWE